MSSRVLDGWERGVGVYPAVVKRAFAVFGIHVHMGRLQYFCDFVDDFFLILAAKGHHDELFATRLYVSDVSRVYRP